MKKPEATTEIKAIAAYYMNEKAKELLHEPAQPCSCPARCSVVWEPEANKPPLCLSVLVYGKLNGESEPDTHEGFWSNKHWWSVRRDETTEKGYAKITDVTHWAARPTPPNNALSKSHENEPQA